MKISKRSGTLGLAVLAAIVSPAGVAAEDAGWVGGINVGQSIARIDNEQIGSRLSNSGLSTTKITNDDRNTSYKIFAGYKFNGLFALEGGFFDLGKFGYVASTVPAGTASGEMKLRGMYLDAVGTLPMTEKFFALARIGGNYAEARDTFSNTGAVPVPTIPSPSQNAYNFKAGLGLQYNFSDSVGVRGEWERLRVNDAVGSRGDIEMVSVGLIVSLDGKKASSEPIVATPPPPEPVMAESLPPEPVMVIVPVLVKTQKYCSILDLQFEIKQGEIQREDKEKLNVLGTFMKKYPDTTAVIEGHADDVGTDEFNLKLSRQRAESVVNYLVSSQHIEAKRLTAVGYGSSRPIADNSTRAGQQANRRIGAVIACATDIEGLRVAGARLTMAMEVEFDPHKADIAPQYYDDLATVANFMKANPSVIATIEGHAGKLVGLGNDKERVSAKVAMEVSERRAQSVANYLVERHGIARSRLSTAAFGSTRRVSYGTTLDGQQENRRVNIIFNYTK